jgi:hypothetical protein
MVLRFAFKALGILTASKERLKDVSCRYRRDRFIQLRFWTPASDGANVTETVPLIGFDRTDLNMVLRRNEQLPLPPEQPTFGH